MVAIVMGSGYVVRGANLLVYLALCVSLNVLIFALGWEESALDDANPLDPPAWLVGAVWLGLFALMALARGDLDRRGRRLVDVLALVCAAFPFHALLPDSARNGLIVCVLTVLLAVAVIVGIAPRARRAAWLLAPLPAWLSFSAMTFVVDQL